MHEAHRYIAAEQAQELGIKDAELILEPHARNTAPAIAAATLRAMRGGEDPVMLIMPSDHVLEDGEVLATAYAQAYLAARQGALVTFGITPTAPLSGYGYIQADAPAAMAPARRVRRFVEKPSPEVAQRFIEEGNYYWNSGMFAFQASVFLAEMDRLAPRMLQQVRAAIAAGHGDDALFQLDGPAFEACPSDSMDYAIMERTDSAVVIPLAAPWSDVGAWDAVWGIAPKSVEGNSTTGDVMVEDSRNCLIHSTSRLVASVGLDDIVVIETADAVLVAHKSRSQDVKRLVEAFKVQHRSELNHHREVQRPWGSYDSVGQGPRYQVKRITVKPGARLSSQMHHHRAEHWIVVSGTARIYNGDKQYLLTENQSTYIPLGEIHSLENRARSRWKSSRCSPAPIWARTTSSDSRTCMAAPDSVQAPFWRPGLARVCVPAAALFFLALVTIGNLPGLAAQMSDAYGDKRLHLAAYATLTCLAYASFNRRPALLAFLSATALGALDEGIQSFFPYRQADLLDLLADISAAGATVISLHIGSAAIGSFRAVTKS